MSPKVVHLPHQRLPRPEAALDRLLERSLLAAFGSQAWLRHSHTDKTYETGRAFNKGEPDYVGVIHGIFVAIENKVYPNRPDDDQLNYLRRLARHTGLAFLLVQDKKGDCFLIQVDENYEAFSWRESEKACWLRLPKVEQGGVTILDLRVLFGLVVTRITHLYQSTKRNS